MFFHGKYPKQKHYVCFDISKEFIRITHFDTAFFNSGNPTNRSYLNNGVKIEWSYKNLLGIIDEAGSRPYLELPYFTLISFYKMIFSSVALDEQKHAFDHWVVSAHFTESQFTKNQFILKGYDWKKYLKEYDNGYVEIIEPFMNVKNDPSRIGSLRSFQNWMSEDVKYHNGLDYYDGTLMALQQTPYKDLKNGFIRDLNIGNAYFEVFMKMDLGFGASYVADKRYGQMQPNYFFPMMENEFIIQATLMDSSKIFLLPKSDIRSYQIEELPFYYEDSKVMTLEIPTKEDIKIGKKYSISKTPKSEVQDNSRKTFSSVVVDLDSSKMTFQTRLNLSGQYSTLCRFIYKDKAPDPTINPIYTIPFYSISKDVKVKSIDVSKTKQVFPFNTTVSSKFESSNLISNTKQGYKIDLSEFIKFVYYPKLDTSNRMSDYYADFVGSDLYSYQFQFSENIKLASDSIKVKKENDFGSYELTIHQTAPDKVLLSCVFITKKEHLKKEDIEMLYEIYRELEKLKKLSIEVIRL